MSTQTMDFVEQPSVVIPLGRRQRFLMCSPKLYEVDYVINPWMRGNVHGASRQRAMEQWQKLYDTVSRIADVELVEPEAGWPDMVFTANAGLERGGTVVLSSFFHPERQGEEPHFRRWFEQAGYRVVELPRNTPFEGEGDALFSTDGAVLFVGHGTRTAESSHEALELLWGMQVISLQLIDPRFYHLDTCFAPLADGSALYFPAAFSPESVSAIEAFYPPDRRIVVGEEDALRFACNAVNVGRTIVLNTVTKELRGNLEACGFEVVEVCLSEFLKAGGAAKCLVMKLMPVE